MKKNSCGRGFTLVEVLVALAIFALFAVGIYGSIHYSLKIIYRSRMDILKTAILSEQIEMIRNLPFESVGIINGVPAGVLPGATTTVRNRINFSLAYSIRNVDDPFDGLLGGSPNDSAPADFKLVQMTVNCIDCPTQQPVTLSTIVGPKNLEGSTNNGALFINVFGEDGQVSVAGANVNVTNTAANPDIFINDVTDNEGYLRIIDVPTGTMAYNIMVTKPGYSKDYTVAPSPSNPNPVKPPANVASQDITEIYFQIDRVGSVNLHTIDETCSPLSNRTFSMSGSKLIGTNPDVLKYSSTMQTDASGNKLISDVEFDTYNLSSIGTGYDLVGVIPMSPFYIAPGMHQDVTLILKPETPHTFLIKVRDSSTGLPLSGALINLTKSGGFSNEKVTGMGFMRQTEWNGGPGQSNFVNENKYFYDDGNINVAGGGDDIQLRKMGGQYFPSGYLESSTFDFGESVDLKNVILLPTYQPVQTGPNSIQIQLAVSNSSSPASWNFTGPDGTESSYYTSTSTIIYTGGNEYRYLRYRVYLSTQNTNYTPQFSEFVVTYVDNCAAPGQSFFSGLSSATYDVTVSKLGYLTATTTFDLSPDWADLEFELFPDH